MTSPKQPKRAEAGVVIGGYELVRRIGRGGMADVWVARRALGKKGTKFVAIKLIADHYVGDERYCRMFRTEAELAAVLSHANIVQVFDEGEEDGRSYLIMEWVDGLNLLKLGDMLALLDDDQRRFRVTAYIIGQLLHALHYAHSITSADGNPLGVVHRDVSPQNVLVSNHGEVKLTDFGVAHQNFEESSGIHVKGKVRYMSPEQLSGKTRLPTVDLYAVGALLHELLDGRRFRGEYDDGQEMFSVVLSGKIPALSRPIPPELDRLRLGLLEADATRRVQSAEQAVTMLKRYPGYGDARDELTKLCGSLTGVVRPRVGPGQSSQMPAAEQATTRWGGGKALSKPKVDGNAVRPPPAPPARVGAPNVPRTGSTTAVKGSKKPPEPAGVLITGQTELVRREQVEELLAGAAPPAPAIPPTTPLRASELYGVVMPANDPVAARGHGEGSPAFAPAQPSRPLDLRPSGYGNASPAFVQAQTSSPIGMRPNGHGSAAPMYAQAQPNEYGGAAPVQVYERPSQPISLQAAPAWGNPSNAPAFPPQPISSEGSGATRHPGTEMIDASMILEVGSGSGTDQEILPPRLAGEGTDTRRESRAMVPTQSNSVSIVLPRRSAVVAIGLGLVLVAAMSVSVTWLLFTRGRGDAVASEPMVAELAGSVVAKELGTPAKRELKPAPTPEPATVVSGGVAEEPAVEEPTGQEEALVEGDGELANGGDAVELEAVDEAPAVAPTAKVEPQRADAEIVTKSKPKPKPKPKAPKVAVRVLGGMGFDKAQVKIGSQIFTVNPSLEVKVTAGKKSLQWRKNAKDSWKPWGSWPFEVGKKVILFVTKDGLKVRNPNG